MQRKSTTLVFFPVVERMLAETRRECDATASRPARIAAKSRSIWTFPDPFRSAIESSSSWQDRRKPDRNVVKQGNHAAIHRSIFIRHSF
jgi:hypothetical protein